ncbi:scaffold protein [Microviridae sp.]|nr:scaffold protein [Microviridae sp.]
MEKIVIGKVIQAREKRPNGTLRSSREYTDCVSKVDKSKAFQNDVNTLIKKHSASEIDMLLKLRAANRRPIQNYDETQEPSLQEAKNEVVRLKNAFNNLDLKVRKQFNHVGEFIEFIDNPQNRDEIIAMGLATLVKPEPIKTEPPAQ